MNVQTLTIATRNVKHIAKVTYMYNDTYPHTRMHNYVIHMHRTSYILASSSVKGVWLLPVAAALAPYPVAPRGGGVMAEIKMELTNS